jgi:2'-hydroxyisoflavone reductase
MRKVSKMSNRRDFLKGTAAAGVGLSLGGLSMIGCAGDAGETADSGPPRPLRILILGGTSFLGPAEVEYAQSRGHTVTLFNRGRTNPELFPDVEKLVGDRSVPDYESLVGREWDAVIDNSANVALWVQQASQVLKDTVGRYLFVSSISAYSDLNTPGMDENGPVFTREDYDEVIASEADFGTAFGPNKAQAERDTFETFGDRGVVVRPGLIVGPRDRSHRFGYWPVRIDRGGEVLCPGDGSSRAQIIDVRDLGRFLVHLVENEASGTYTATGPDYPMTMRQMLEGVREGVGSDATLTWVDADFLREHEVGAWMEMPVYQFPGDGDGLLSANVDKAIAAGLTFRPLTETARDTLEWYNSLPEDQQTMRTGIDPEKEANILAAWHARSG